MQLFKVVLALAVVAFVPSEGTEVKAAVGQSLRAQIAADCNPGCASCGGPSNICCCGTSKCIQNPDLLHHMLCV
jgi:hypothetical protein